jgi:hypothetical protein
MSTTITGSSIQVGSIDLTTPLAVADGGTGISTAKSVAQIVTYATGAMSTGTTPFPFDNTIPQITEGDQYLTVNITPTNASSLLEIDVTLNATGTTWASVGGCVALFQVGTSNALCSAVDTLANSSARTTSFKHIMTAGSTSTLTFTVRAGGASGTTTVNGQAGTAYHGGTLPSRITIKEWLA